MFFADLLELNGAMGRFMLTTMASVAELEAGLISANQGGAESCQGAWGVPVPRFLRATIARRLARERFRLARGFMKSSTTATARSSFLRNFARDGECYRGHAVN
jgi:hypothetical protein